VTNDPHGRNRRSIRLPGFDYRSHGWYFPTLVTLGRECLFDHPTLRSIAETFWTRLPLHFPHLTIDEWVLMPNHLHAILVLMGGKPDGPIPADGVASGSLGAIIGNYKSISTRRINAIRKLEGRQVWQRNYYEHIIRSECELEGIRTYIRDNPANWLLDREHRESSS
jgi:REP element-mobilizing transposase RayT